MKLPGSLTLAGDTYDFSISFDPGDQRQLDMFELTIRAQTLHKAPYVLGQGDWLSQTFQANGLKPSRNAPHTFTLTVKHTHLSARVLAQRASFSIHMPYPASGLPLVIAEKNPEEADIWFCARVPVVASAATAAPRLSDDPLITLFWDCSYSRMNEQLEAEFLFISQLVTSLPLATFDVFLFREQCAKSQRFQCGIDPSPLLTFLRAAPFDGGTDLGALPFPIKDVTTVSGREYTIHLLFTDGFGTWNTTGCEMPPVPPAPIFATSSAIKCNTPLLKALAHRSGGAFLPLKNTGDVQTAVNTVIARPLVLLSVEKPHQIQELYPAVRTPVLSNCCTVVGNIIAATADAVFTVTLNFGYTAKCLSITVTVDLFRNIIPHEGLVRQMWAVKKVEHLMQTTLEGSDRSKTLTQIGRSYGIVTPNTSLIVLDTVEHYLKYDCVPPHSLPKVQQEYFLRKEAFEKEQEERQRRKVDCVENAWQKRCDWFACDYDGDTPQPNVLHFMPRGSHLEDIATHALRQCPPLHELQILSETPPMSRETEGIPPSPREVLAKSHKQKVLKKGKPLPTATKSNDVQLTPFQPARLLEPANHEEAISGNEIEGAKHSMLAELESNEAEKVVDFVCGKTLPRYTTLPRVEMQVPEKVEQNGKQEKEQAEEHQEIEVEKEVMEVREQEAQKVACTKEKDERIVEEEEMSSLFDLFGGDSEPVKEGHKSELIGEEVDDEDGINTSGDTETEAAAVPAIPQLPPMCDLKQLRREVECKKRVMATNIDKVLQRGERLDDIVAQSENLSQSSCIFLKKSKKLNSPFSILSKIPSFFSSIRVSTRRKAFVGESAKTEAHRSPSAEASPVSVTTLGGVSASFAGGTYAFSHDSTATIGASFGSMAAKAGSDVVHVAVWDTAGQERFHSITRLYYRGASCIILMYDVTSRASLESLRNGTLSEARTQGGESTPIVIIGNKIDLKQERQVSTAEGYQFAKSSGLQFFEISCLTRENAGTAIEYIVGHAYLQARSAHTKVVPLGDSGVGKTCFVKLMNAYSVDLSALVQQYPLVASGEELRRRPPPTRRCGTRLLEASATLLSLLLHAVMAVVLLLLAPGRVLLRALTFSSEVCFPPVQSADEPLLQQLQPSMQNAVRHVIVLGANCCGKSALCRRLVKNGDTVPEGGTWITSNATQIYHEQRIGTKRMPDPTPIVALVVYSVDDATSFDGAIQAVEELGPSVSVLLVAAKCDSTAWVVCRDRAEVRIHCNSLANHFYHAIPFSQQQAARLNVPYVETSALAGFNIDAVAAFISSQQLPQPPLYPRIDDEPTPDASLAVFQPTVRPECTFEQCCHSWCDSASLPSPSESQLQQVPKKISHAEADQADLYGSDGTAEETVQKLWNGAAHACGLVAAEDFDYGAYMTLRGNGNHGYEFYLCAARLLFAKGETENGLRVASTVLELDLANHRFMRTVAFLLEEFGLWRHACFLYEQLLHQRGEEPRSYFDVLLSYCANDPPRVADCVPVADQLLKRQWPARFSQVEIPALMELHRLAHCRVSDVALPWVTSDGPLPVDVLVRVRWAEDDCAVELRVREPTGEWCYPLHNHTALGGVITRDMPGYGPVEYCLRKAHPGVYAVYVRAARPPSVGCVSVMLDVYTRYGAVGGPLAFGDCEAEAEAETRRERHVSVHVLLPRSGNQLEHVADVCW
eukprot:TRINITY_DN3317_c0_g2_i5.p1 TRINITY_DN3317_c0_g2~~TRINITY_DN3317_c0_g2_i5.p1  ORF type:complete len:1683 (-),score=304.17 TRINITY_DN3317_c0_g2_i5:623-5671(-)